MHLGGAEHSLCIFVVSTRQAAWRVCMPARPTGLQTWAQPPAAPYAAANT